MSDDGEQGEAMSDDGEQRVVSVMELRLERTACCEGMRRLLRVPGDDTTLVGWLCELHGLTLRTSGEALAPEISAWEHATTSGEKILAPDGLGWELTGAEGRAPRFYWHWRRQSHSAAVAVTKGPYSWSWMRSALERIYADCAGCRPDSLLGLVRDVAAIAIGRPPCRPENRAALREEASGPEGIPRDMPPRAASWHVEALIPPDDRWAKKRTAYYACRDAGVAIPAEVREFFGGREPDDLPGYLIDLTWGDDATSPVARSSSTVTGREELSIDIGRLPEGATVIKIFGPKR